MDDKKPFVFIITRVYKHESTGTEYSISVTYQYTGGKYANWSF